jgi:hypothetical protein
MTRTQIQLTERQQAALRAMAASTGRSVSDLVREAVDERILSRRKVSREELVQRSLKAIGRFASNSPDGSKEHDRYLAEAYG